MEQIRRPDFEAFLKQLNIPLTEQQRAAVQTVKGPVLLLAVPGSGKTTVLVARLGYMIYCLGIPPERILTLTYTVAATRDMADRFERFFGGEYAGRAEFRTINGICQKIINYYASAPFRLETNEKNILAILSGIYLRTEEDYPGESDLREIRTKITYIKNMMLTPEEIGTLDEDSDYHLQEIYTAYVREMQARSLMDYDDQLRYALQILLRSPETLRHFREIYPYICVDEAQDTSRIQHRIIGLLAGDQPNLFMVGDEDQSIYGFRAAYPQALLDFEKTYPGAKVLLMEDNFRSNALIVTCADAFIRENTLRHAKTMRAVRPPAREVRVTDLVSRSAQYSYLRKVAQGAAEQTAILYRDNECMLPLMDSFEREGIPYRVRNADISFFSHRVVRDICDILRFAAEPDNGELFLNIYYKIKTYLKKEQAGQIVRLAGQRGDAILSAALYYGGLRPMTYTAIREIITTLGQIRRAESGAVALRLVCSDLGYSAYLDRAGIAGDGKLAILRALAAKTSSGQALVARLEELRQILETKAYDAHCPLILSTIHASKGLEYEHVYLMDVMDGILPENLPTRRERQDPEILRAYEEERRLFYVGITRAKKTLDIFRVGQATAFVDELMPREKAGSRNTEGKKADGKNTAGEKTAAETGKKVAKAAAERRGTGTGQAQDHRLSRGQKSLEKQTDRTEATPEGAAARPVRPDYEALARDPDFVSFVKLLKKGRVVQHKKYGYGKVLSNNFRIISIRFGQVEKRFDIGLLYLGGYLEL